MSKEPINCKNTNISLCYRCINWDNGEQCWIKFYIEAIKQKNGLMPYIKSDPAFPAQFLEAIKF